MENKEPKLTPGQQRAVDVRDANVLVAAAAGSGKTKVLVDRIIGKVTDGDNPCNVDDFLVVTFTNAAAAQMRDKIRGKLQKALESNPSSQHLSRQQLLVNRADICTIDSFCLKLVKENFNMLDIDSSFTIGDPGMMEMVKAEVMDNLFERLYDEGDEDFKALVDIFCSKNQDDELKEAISQVYYKASSYPVPERWLSNAKSCLNVNDESALDKLPWVRYYINSIKSDLADVIRDIDEVMALCDLPGGPDLYMEALELDKEIIEGMTAANTYETLRTSLPSKWPTLRQIKGDGYDGDIKTKAQKLRNKYKDKVKKLLPSKSALELIEELNLLATYIVPLIELTETFSQEYMQEKKARRMLEFSDIEHMAHNLVCGGYDEDGNPIPTELAQNISLGIKEIYIDEYQDSNFLQEEILSCVSGNYRGCPNMFMVGDVKQSIYRFRMARPDLFIGKYNTFQETGDNVKILLNNNFRSRAEVLEPINYIFYQLMGEDLGGIIYDKSVSLVPTMEFPEPTEEEKPYISQNTEVMLLNLQEEDDEVAIDFSSADNGSEDFILEENDLETMKNLELEAHMIAGRIKELLDKDKGMLVYDEDKKCYRKASYRDIVILTRSMAGVGEYFYNILNSHGIPVYVSDPKGYFDAVEVRVVMSLLAVVDNSKQDIPLSAVLMSPIAGLNETDLAIICNHSKDKTLQYLYDKCQLYMLDKDDAISEKMNSFFTLLEELKSKKNKLSISQLIWEALEVTGYYTYVSAMPMGHRRRANLDMLLEKADVYENGYYKGLFNFLRYVDKLKINQIDFGEATVVSDDEDVVRIMTMHSSKGLEYPIVFVSALGKYFNDNEYKGNLIINNDYFLAMKYMNRAKRYSKATVIRDAFKAINMSEGIAEELRVLYVALTRAKEKLIITGHTKQYTSILEKALKLNEVSDVLLPYPIRKRSHCFIELIVAAMARFDQFKDTYGVGDKLTMTVVDKAMLAGNIVKEQEDTAIKVEELIDKLKNQVDEDILSRIRECFADDYRYKKLSQLNSKMSVSDIKKQKAFDGAGYDESHFENKALEGEAFVDDSEDACDVCSVDNVRNAANAANVINTATVADTKPVKDSSKNCKLTGAERGTIVHKCMELVDFASLDGEKNLYRYAGEHKKSLKDRGIYDDIELRAINCRKVANMLKSNLGQRMIKAATRGELFKEQKFSIGFPVSHIYDTEDLKDVDDIVIVQGIVDGYFVEDGAIVVMDYKTDACDEETLIGRYKAQLDYYADTLAKLRGLPVKEKIMYSFGMEKEVPV